MLKLDVPEKNLEHLKVYKCSGDDKSITRTYILNPYVYETLIKFFPKWLAPNVITLAGFFMIILSASVCAYYAPTMTELTVPRWVFFLNAFCLFAYQTLDNLDGKQARNTKQSSPLGEMFDHGCDAISCTFGGFNWVLLCAQGPSFFSFAIILVSWLPFAFATWEEYYVGGLYLGYLNGPIEGLLSMQFGQLVAGFLGQQFWHMPLKQFSPSLASMLPFIADARLVIIVTSLTLMVALLNSALNVINVYKRVQKNKQQAKTIGIKPEDLVWKETSFISALSNLIPFAILIGGASVWLLISPANIFAIHPYLFLCSMGIGFGYLASNVTLGFLLKISLKKFSYSICLPVALCVMNALVARIVGRALISEVNTLYIYTIIAFIVYTKFVLTVCLHISSYLGIGVLRILPSKSQ